MNLYTLHEQYERNRLKGHDKKHSKAMRKRYRAKAKKYLQLYKERRLLMLLTKE